LFYDAVGGVTSLFTEASVCGFLRSVKKPTATGISIKMKATQTNAIPTVGDKEASLKVPLPVAVIAPNKNINKPGHPHKKTAAMVAIKPVFLLFIIISPQDFYLV
jgi:hypothetical protein